MLTKAFEEAIPILETIEKHGFHAYFVGGCVRDLFLEKEVNDIDIATSASPQMIQKIFPKVIPVGIEHGTVIVRFENKSYEVTTFRLDGKYTDQRRPDKVKFISNINEDLKRRDFTMNALALDRKGVLIDLFKGQQDINQHIIRTVGNGAQRFTEDALRIVRALRFVSQLGFNIEVDTLTAMDALKDNLQSLAIERIYNEFVKMISGRHFQKALKYMIELNIERHLPVFKEHIELLKSIPSHVNCVNSFGVFITMLQYINNSLTIEDWTKTWKCSNKVKNEAIALRNSLLYYDENGVDSFLVYQLPVNLDENFVQLIQFLFPKANITITEIKDIRTYLPISLRSELAIKGDEVLSMFPDLNKGKWIHDLILQLEKAVVLNDVKNTKNELKEWIKCNPPVIN